MVRLALYDPAHIPERLTIYSVDKHATVLVVGGECTDREPDTPVAALADAERRRTVGTARIDGAIAGTPFLIALVPAYIAFLRQEIRFHLRVAALYGRDPADPSVAADFLVLRGVHKNDAEALAELDAVRANPLPPHRHRTPLRSWYQAVISVLVLAGFIQAAADDDRPIPVTGWQRSCAQCVRRGRVVIWVDLGDPDHLHDRHVLDLRERWRRFGQRVLARYDGEGADNAVA